MIAHVVFDLAVEGPFDYLIPEQLSSQVVFGAWVKVMFGPKAMTGFVVAVAKETSIPNLKPIKAACDAQPVFDQRDLTFAQRFAGYYGCSLGEALGLMTRHRSSRPLPNPAPYGAGEGNTVLYHCPDGRYVPVIEQLTGGRSDYFIIVPDAFIAGGLALSAQQRSLTGLRSSMFEAFARCNLIIVVDDDNASFKQEQSPMYETRQVILMAQQVYGFDVAFIGISPSVELMHLARTKAIKYQLSLLPSLPAPYGAGEGKLVVIDLTNYKFLEKKMLSPPARNAIEANMAAKRRTLIILNFLDGVEQLRKDLSALFPKGKIICFTRGLHDLPAWFDVCVATRAVLRFRGRLQAHTVVLADLDAGLNREDMRSSFKAWSLAQHLRLLGDQVLIQTRNLDHHVLKALSRDDAAFFYNEEFRLRQELGFTPFYHWVAVIARARAEKSARDFARDMYNALIKDKPDGMVVTDPQPDMPAKLRDQYRFRIMAGGKEVGPMMGFIKNTLRALKRGRVIVTLNVDP